MTDRSNTTDLTPQQIDHVSTVLAIILTPLLLGGPWLLFLVLCHGRIWP